MTKEVANEVKNKIYQIKKCVNLVCQREMHICMHTTTQRCRTMTYGTIGIDYLMLDNCSGEHLTSMTNW